MALLLGDAECVLSLLPNALKTCTDDAAVKAVLQVRALLHDACSSLNMKTLQLAVDRNVLIESLNVLQAVGERDACCSDSRLPLLTTSLLSDIQTLFSVSVPSHDANIGHVPLLTYFLCERHQFGDDIQWRSAELIALKTFTNAMLSVLRAQWLPIGARLFAITNLSSALLVFPPTRATVSMLDAWYEDSALYTLFQIPFNESTPPTATVGAALNASRAVVSMLVFGVGLNTLNKLAMSSLIVNIKNVINGNRVDSKRCTCEFCEDARICCRTASVGVFVDDSQSKVSSNRVTPSVRRSQWASRVLCQGVVGFLKNLHRMVERHDDTAAAEVAINDAALIALLICHSCERRADEHRDTRDDDISRVAVEMCHLAEYLLTHLRASKLKGTLLLSFSNMTVLSAVLKLLLHLKDSKGMDDSVFLSALEVLSGCMSDVIHLNSVELTAAPLAAPFMAAALVAYRVAKDLVRTPRGVLPSVGGEVQSEGNDFGRQVAAATAAIAKAECSKNVNDDKALPDAKITEICIINHSLFALMAVTAGLPTKNATPESRQWLLTPPPKYTSFVKDTGANIIAFLESHTESWNIRRCTYLHNLCTELNVISDHIQE